MGHAGHLFHAFFRILTAPDHEAHEKGPTHGGDQHHSQRGHGHAGQADGETAGLVAGGGGRRFLKTFP